MGGIAPENEFSRLALLNGFRKGAAVRTVILSMILETGRACSAPTIAWAILSFAKSQALQSLCQCWVLLSPKPYNRSGDVKFC